MSSRRRWLPALLALLGLGVVALVARPEQVLVERVQFEGASRATAAALRHLVDVSNGTTMWGVDLERAQRGAASHPWVKSATARRKFPDTVVIRVEEYQPVALLAGDTLRYVDRSGVVFLEARSDDVDYPVITGVDGALHRAHPDLPRLVVRDALWLMDTLDTRGVLARGGLSEVAFSRTRGFTLHLGSGAEVRFGLEGLERQIDRLAQLLGEGVDLDTPVLVDLAPASVAIVRPLVAAGEG